MSEIKIQTTITLDESAGVSNSDIKVPLVLDSSSATLWHVDDSTTRIDAIDVEFGVKPIENRKGNITLWISLLAGERFVSPFLTKEKLESESSTGLACIEFKPRRKDTILELDFEQPPEGDSFDYPQVFFHTTAGIVDPIIRIKRRVP